MIVIVIVIVIATIIVREVTTKCESKRHYRTRVSLPGVFRGCIAIFKMAEGGHESHILVLLLLFFFKRTIIWR